MKYTLESCKHRRLETWGDGAKHATCLLCFRRFRLAADRDTRRRIYLDAPPWDGQCLHVTSFLKPFDRMGKQDSHDYAICVNCGCVVSHPPGPGKWTPVLFYGYVIDEVPDVFSGP